MKLTWIFVGGYFLLLWVGMRAKTPEMVGGWWFFLRAFFPNWKFFHALGFAPRLYVRHHWPSETGGSWGAWVKIYPRHERQWFHCFHNPWVNLSLGYQNLVEHLVADLNAMPEGQDVRHLTTYQLVAQRVKLTKSVNSDGVQASACQFQICMQTPWIHHPESWLENEVMLLSEEFKS